MEIQSPQYLAVDEYARQELLAKEKEMLGIYISGHPLEDYEQRMTEEGFITALMLNPQVKADQDNEELLLQQNELHDRQEVKMAGMLTKRRNITTKKNELMSFMTLEDLTGQFECVVFPRTLEQINGFIREGRVIALKGEVSQKEDFPNSLIIKEAELMPKDNEAWPEGSLFITARPMFRPEAVAPAQPLPEEENIAVADEDMSPGQAKLVVKLPTASTEGPSRSLLALCRFWRGKTPIAVFYEADDTYLELPSEITVETSPLFLHALVERYGINNIWIGTGE